MNSANQILVFDRALLRRRRNRAAPQLAAHSALFDEIAEQLIDRLADVKRDFTSVLDLGASSGVEKHLPNAFVVAADMAEQKLRQTNMNSLPLAGRAREGGGQQETPSPAKTKDLAEAKSKFSLPGLACPASKPASLTAFAASPQGERNICVVADEEFLPFAARSFDLIISNASLHWVNDLPGALVQIRNALRPDGLFLASVLGGQTLQELRACLLDAELAVTGGISPRLSPTIELQTASGLLQRTGFALPVADSEIITLTYPNAYALMRDLRGMGETNTHLHRLRSPSRRAVFQHAANLYQERYGLVNGHIPATFEVLFLHGWAG